jgi:hypothetical protein
VLGGGPETARGTDAAKVADPFTLHPDQYVLSGGPAPTDPIDVDDDLEVLVGDAKLFLDDDHLRSTDTRFGKDRRTYDGSPLILRLPPGATFRVRAVDCAPTEAGLSELWLHRWDGAKRRLTPAVKEKSNAQLPHVFFDKEYKVAEGFDPAPVRAAPARTDREREALWEDLGSDDPSKAYFAEWGLAADPDGAVLLLRDRIRPAAGADDKRTARLIAQLDDDDFDVRERATATLADLGESAEAALRRARPAASDEATQRIDRLLRRLQEAGPSPGRRRALRAVGALEHMGSPAARGVLEALAGGAAEAATTEAARAALKRLDAAMAP